MELTLFGGWRLLVGGCVLAVGCLLHFASFGAFHKQRGWVFVLRLGVAAILVWIGLHLCFRVGDATIGAVSWRHYGPTTERISVVSRFA